MFLKNNVHTHLVGLITKMAVIFSLLHLHTNSKGDHVGRVWNEREGETGPQEKLGHSL